MNFPFFKKKKQEEIGYDFDKETGVVRFEHDEKTSGKDSVGMLEAFSATGDIPIYKGKPPIEHAYESDFLGYTDKCPLCNTPTKQMYSNFVWANQEASRLMSAPAGHFCTHCPTVIIDDAIVKTGVNKAKYEYWGVCGIDSGYSDKKDDINLFQTLNGEKPTYILSEEGGLDGILNSVHAPSEGMYQDSSGKVFGNSYSDSDTLGSSNAVAKSKQAINKKAKNKSKNKQAKQSRKANRKK
jgi:hypothetical protein